MKLYKIIDEIKELKRNIEYDPGAWSMNDVLDRLNDLEDFVWDFQNELDNGE